MWMSEGRHGECPRGLDSNSECWGVTEGSREKAMTLPRGQNLTSHELGIGKHPLGSHSWEQDEETYHRHSQMTTVKGIALPK